MTYTDLISTIGVSLILIAFFLHTFKLISDSGVMYYVLNIIGGAFACYGSVLLNSVPFSILEGVWSLVAIAGLIRGFKKIDTQA